MFFMMGIMDRQKDLSFNQTIICDICGKYGSYQVFVTYTVLSLFFIPCFKWNKHYYVRTSCCGTIYELDAMVGKSIEKGVSTEIRKENLISVVNRGKKVKRCSNCGYTTEEDFEFCPKCGRVL